jgi:hypothetical protein
VKKIISAHEIIDISNELMLIKKHKTILVNDKINEKNRRMFFDNIVYVSSIEITFMFVTRLKRQRYV